MWSMFLCCSDGEKNVFRVKTQNLEKRDVPFFLEFSPESPVKINTRNYETDCILTSSHGATFSKNGAIKWWFPVRRFSFCQPEGQNNSSRKKRGQFYMENLHISRKALLLLLLSKKNILLLTKWRCTVRVLLEWRQWSTTLFQSSFRVYIRCWGWPAHVPSHLISRKLSYLSIYRRIA